MTETVPALLWYLQPHVVAADEVWMLRAIRLAKEPRSHDLPFGCVIVGPEGKELAVAWGTGNRDPLAHSEMTAIQLVAAHYQEPDWLRGCTLYSTHEPCSMCCGGINHAKISRVVWGSYRHDLPQLFRPKRSAHGSLADTSHPPVTLGGVLQKECIQLFADIAKWDTCS